QAEDGRCGEAGQSAIGGFASEEAGGFGHRTDHLRPAARPAPLADPAANLGGAGDGASRLHGCDGIGEAIVLHHSVTETQRKTDSWILLCDSVVNYSSPTAYWRKPIQPSAMTMEFPGLRESYFTDVG